MKELHKHIFSNTTCISKETMLKHINKQLSKKELYEVEKHMLDCELCSDAFAGMRYTQNSSILFAIDNTIDKRVGSGTSKAPIMRSLVVAASVLVILFGSYFSVNYFNRTINNDGNLALNEEKRIASNKMPQEESIVVENSEINSEDNNIQSEVLQRELVQKVSIVENKKIALTEVSEPVIVEQELMDDFSNDVIEEGFELEEEVVVEESAVEDVSGQELTSALHVGSVISGEALQKEERTAAKTKSNKKRSKRVDNEAQVPVKNVSSNSAVKFKDETKENLLVIDGYKVFDYRKEYQEAYDSKKADLFVTESVSADFEGKTDKDLANKEFEETIVEVTYQDVLGDAIRLYKNKQYKEALQEFDMIIAEHFRDVNAQFYMGLCFYHLAQNKSAINKFNSVLKNKQTEFNEEANWYKVLTLIKMKDTTSAKNLLKSIVKQNGFYKIKAEEKLEGLK